jgi:hypothetical protein
VSGAVQVADRARSGLRIAAASGIVEGVALDTGRKGPQRTAATFAGL